MMRLGKKKTHKRVTEAYKVVTVQRCRPESKDSSPVDEATEAGCWIQF